MNLLNKSSQLSDTAVILYVFLTVRMVYFTQHQVWEDYHQLNKVLSAFLEAIRMIRMSLIF